jgi:hypothetical protein
VNRSYLQWQIADNNDQSREHAAGREHIAYSFISLNRRS